MRTIDKPFGEIDIFNFVEVIKDKIKEEINKNSKEYILGVNEDEYVEYLYQTFYIQPLSVDLSSEDVEFEREQQKSFVNRWGEEEYYKEYRFNIYFNYSGEPLLFRVQPSTWFVGGSWSEIEILDSNRLKIHFSIHNQNTEEFNREKQGVINTTFRNLKNVNIEIGRFNDELRSTAKAYFESIKTEIQKENAFFSSIKVRVGENREIKYAVPVIEKKVPFPIVAFDEQKNPVLTDNIYQRILHTIDTTYKEFEKLPNNYKDKDEEALRDGILPALNTTYAMSGMVATGETFNKNGKTDICIKHTDNTNVFIAECKIWKGEKLFEDAINQLFDRYVTWHDTKVALIIFVKQDNFTEIITKAKEAIKKHPYFLRTINAENSTRGSYIFRHAEDKQRQIKLELMLYHFNQK